MDKKSLLLAGIRGILFALLACSTFDILTFSFLSQVAISIGIILSDIYDENIPRKENTEENKIKFRKIDTFVDKMGILICMFGLFMTGKINSFMLASILGYNTIIVIGGIEQMKHYKELTETKISGNIFSRTANIMTALFCLCSNNILNTSTLKNTISFLLISSFGVSLGNHCRLIQQEIKSKKSIPVYSNIELKKVDISTISSKQNIYEARKSLINELKVIRDMLIDEKKESLEFEESVENKKTLL